METVLENETKIKEVFKLAVMEALEERKDLFGKLFREISEDIALAKAIEEAEKTPKVSRKEIFKALEKQS
jgi:vacuolar-type H+-ATPase catalytic subunit A/Vma1